MGFDTVPKNMEHCAGSGRPAGEVLLAQNMGARGDGQRSTSTNLARAEAHAQHSEKRALDASKRETRRWHHSRLWKRNFE